MTATTKTRVTTRQRIGESLSSWHRSSGCPIYVVGSHWRANKTVSTVDGEACVFDLSYLLSRMKGSQAYSMMDRRELRLLIARVKSQIKRDSK
jgi:hypothetical protein